MCFAGCPSTGMCLFLIIRLGFWVLRRKTTLCQGYTSSTLLVTVDGDLGRLAEVVFARCLHCKIATPPPRLFSLEGSHDALAAHTSGVRNCPPAS